MESRVSDCAARHARGFNCAQAIACTYADLVGADEKTMFAATEGLGLGMGGMQGTCGALSGACVICGLANSCADLEAPTSKAAPTRTPAISSAALRRSRVPRAAPTSRASRRARCCAPAPSA